MKVTWHDSGSEVNFLLGLFGYTVEITPKEGEPFDAVVESADCGAEGVELVYYPFDEEAGEADQSDDPQAIDVEDIVELSIY